MYGVTYSRMIYRNSRVLKNPLYLTMFGCLIRVSRRSGLGMDTHIQVLEQVDL